MAYSILLSLENVIYKILNHDRFSISPHEKEQLISINKCVISFQAFLDEFPKNAKNLEARIRGVADEAESNIECFLQDELYNEWIAKGGIYKLEKVRGEMESIAAEVVELQNSIIIKDMQDGDPVEATSLPQVAEGGEINMVGFNEDLLEIKEKLCGLAPKLQILPISGMGGIGKTTLARNAYDDQLIVEHFQVRVWITVSQDYSLRRILLDLLGSLKEFNTDGRKESIATRSEKGNEALANKSDFEIESVAKRSQQLDEFVKRSKQGNKPQVKIPEVSNGEMVSEVHKILVVRRFLIVMDDIWSTKVLDDVRHLFPDSNNGSRIMLTTRLIEVATYAKSSTLSHEMHLLDADRSWNLLCHKVFIHQDNVPQELESIGREIARSCGGLPLAIVVIAGLLSTTNKSLNALENIAYNVRAALATADGQIEKILSISYNHLPHRLRSCFLYIGGFPEDHEIKVTDLIKLWIAESFVKPVVSKEFEDIAQEYLEDLVDRSLLMVTKRYSNGKITFCSLHDTLREMCIKLSREENFLLHVKDSEVLRESMSHQRRISISQFKLKFFPTIDKSTIRTIMYFNAYLNSFRNFSFLKILNLLTTRHQSPWLSDEFFKLFQLRYLAFCNSNPVPRAISNLQSLQTLIIKEISDPCLPYEIWNMLQLRHIILSKIRLADTTPTTSTLENLQTLGKVENLTCSISTLNLIPNLTKLSLIYSFGSGELLLHNLVHLRRLEKLHLEIGYGWRNFGKPNLVVPSSLRKLTLMGWGRKEPYLDIVGPFPNLEVLKLKSFDFMLPEWRTAEEDFPELKFLLIEESDLRQWNTETSHFPKLKSLLFHSCCGLTEIPECIGEIPTLELIELKDCTDSLVDSAEAIQEEARNYGEDVFQVRCIACKRSRDLRQSSLYEEAMTKSQEVRHILLGLRRW